MASPLQGMYLLDGSWSEDIDLLSLQKQHQKNAQTQVKSEAVCSTSTVEEASRTDFHFCSVSGFIYLSECFNMRSCMKVQKMPHHAPIAKDKWMRACEKGNIYLLGNNISLWPGQAKHAESTSTHRENNTTSRKVQD